MAGIKVTDLPVLGAAETDDVFYIVDTSTNTSKQIEVGNVLSSGSYTPTFSAETNGIQAFDNVATYIKVGNIVNVMAQIRIELAAGENTGSFEMSLPIPSNFASPKNLFGMMQYSFGGVVGEIVNLDINAEITNNTCFVDLETLTNEISMSYCTLQFQYTII